MPPCRAVWNEQRASGELIELEIGCEEVHRKFVCDGLYDLPHHTRADGAVGPEGDHDRVDLPDQAGELPDPGIVVCKPIPGGDNQCGPTFTQKPLGSAIEERLVQSDRGRQVDDLAA
jgi:hypothetical protein